MPVTTVVPTDVDLGAGVFPEQFVRLANESERAASHLTEVLTRAQRFEIAEAVRNATEAVRQLAALSAETEHVAALFADIRINSALFLGQGFEAIRTASARTELVGLSEGLRGLPSVFANALGEIQFLAAFPGGSASAFADVEAQIEFVGMFYGIRAPAEVIPLLRDLPGVPALLMAAVGPIRQYFGLDAQVELRRFSDPESDGKDPRVFADIQTPLDVGEALKRLERFDTDWFIPRLGTVSPRFNFGIEYL